MSAKITFSPPVLGMPLTAAAYYPCQVLSVITLPVQRMNEPEDLSKHKMLPRVSCRSNTKREKNTDSENTFIRTDWEVPTACETEIRFCVCSMFVFISSQTGILLECSGTWITRMHALVYSVAEWNWHSVALRTQIGEAARGCMTNAQICPTTGTYTYKTTDNKDAWSTHHIGPVASSISYHSVN